MGDKKKTASQEDYDHPAAGWGAAKAVTKVLAKSGEWY